MTSDPKIAAAVHLALLHAIEEGRGTSTEHHARQLLAKQEGDEGGENPKEEATRQVAELRVAVRLADDPRTKRLRAACLNWWERELISLGGDPSDALDYTPRPTSGAPFLVYKGIAYAQPWGAC